MEIAQYGLPSKVKFCKRCVISNQRPSSSVELEAKVEDFKSAITIDKDGICDACKYSVYKSTAIDWNDREQQLHELSRRLDSHPGYNIVVPGSGGKDSAFTAHVLKYKYGFRPLTVTWAPHMYTEIGWKNFESWIQVGGLDNILFTPNGKLHRHLTKLAFENLLHPFQPFIIGQKIIGPAMALKFNIPAVFYGENQAEYGNDIQDNQSPLMDPSFFSRVDSFENARIAGTLVSEIIENSEFSIDDFLPYIPPSIDDIKKSQLEVHYLGYYLRWDPQECYYYAVENTGFRPNPSRTEGTYSKYSSIDDKVDPFHFYTTLIKFGLGRASYDAAQEIRNGKITREEGVNLVKKFDLEFPHKYFPEFLEYIQLTEAEFHEIIEKFRSKHLWQKRDSGEWELLSPVWDHE